MTNQVIVLDRSIKDVNYNLVNQFDKLFENYLNNLQELAIAYVNMIESNIKYKEILMNKYEFTCPSFWRHLENIGRNKLYPQLFVYQNSIWINKVLKLSLTEQQDLFENGVSVYCQGNDSLKVKLQDLSKAQVDIVFDSNNGNVRSLAAQKAYIESQKVEKEIIDFKIINKSKKKYKIKDGFAVIKNVRFTKDELLEMVRELRVA